MTETMNLIELSPYLQTTADAKLLSGLLTKLHESFFKKQQSPDAIWAKEIPATLSSSLQKLAAENNVSTSDPSSMQSFLVKVQESITALPQLELTLSIAPTKDFIKQITRTIARQSNKLVLIALKVDQSIIAGAQIGFQGRYKDYSLRKQLETTN